MFLGILAQEYVHRMYFCAGRSVVYHLRQQHQVLCVDLAVSVEVGSLGDEPFCSPAHDVAPKHLVVEHIHLSVAVDVTRGDRLRVGEEEVVWRDVCSTERGVVLPMVEERPAIVVGHIALCGAAKGRPRLGIAAREGLGVGSRCDAIAREGDTLACININNVSSTKLNQKRVS